MKPIWKRWLVFLLILVMVLGILPVANASQIEPTQIPEETAAPETITQTEEPTTETTAPFVQEETLPEETIPFIAGNVESSIALLADAEIVGAPNAFANLTLQNGGIDIPAQGYIQHKNILPLYSLYLTNQPGYANNYYVAYCIEPGVELGNSGGHYGTSYTIDSMEDGSGALYRLNFRITDRELGYGTPGEKYAANVAAIRTLQRLENENRLATPAEQEILSRYAVHVDYRLTMKGAVSHTISLGADIYGNITRMDNLVDGMAKELENYRTVLQDTHTQLSNAKAELETPFAKEAELAEKSARLKELNILLNMDQKDKTLLDGCMENEQDKIRQWNHER